MSAIVATLVVKKPNGQPDELFHDARIDTLSSDSSSGTSTFRAYSYEVMDGDVLKIYQHAREWDYGRWNTVDTVGVEIAHFRTDQWESVRSS